jgi:hypothetical protein
LEFPNNTTLKLDETKERLEPPPENSPLNSIEGNNKGSSNPDKSDNQNEDSSSQVASQKDNNMPQFSADLDESGMTDVNTSISMAKKKKVKKMKKKVKKKINKDISPKAGQQIEEDLLKAQIAESNTPFQ